MKMISEIIKELQAAVEKHGDTELFHEDGGCRGYVLSRIMFDENEECIRIQ